MIRLVHYQAGKLLRSAWVPECRSLARTLEDINEGVSESWGEIWPDACYIRKIIAGEAYTDIVDPISLRKKTVDHIWRRRWFWPGDRLHGIYETQLIPPSRSYDSKVRVFWRGMERQVERRYIKMAELKTMTELFPEAQDSSPKVLRRIKAKV